MLIIITCAWAILVPGILLCVYVLNLSIVGIWVYIAAYIGFVCTIIFIRFRSGKWKNINMIEKVSYRKDGTGRRLAVIPE